MSALKYRVGYFPKSEVQSTMMNFYPVNVGHIFPNINSREVTKMFKDVGTVKNSQMVRSGDRKSQKCIIYFEKLVDAVEAIIRFDKADSYIGQKLKVKAGDNRVSEQLQTKINELEKTVPAPLDHEQIENQTLIIVQNLKDTIDESSLENIFQRFGKIDGISIKKEGGKSRGFGYIDFGTHKAALRAVRNMDGCCIEGNPLKVAFVEDKESRKKKMQAEKDKLIKANQDQTFLLVKNFKDLIDEEDLKRMFDKFGLVKSVSIAKQNGRSKGYGFVNYGEHASALLAIEHMDDSVLGNSDRHITVAFVEPKESREKSVPPKSPVKAEKPEGENTLIIVRNFRDQLDEDSLKKLFHQFGEIVSISIKRINGVSQGYGYVNFKNSLSAGNAVNSMDKWKYQDRELQVAFVEKKEVRVQKALAKICPPNVLDNIPKPNVLLNVQYLPKDTTNKELFGLFKGFGNISSCTVKCYEQWHTAIGYISFSNVREAQSALCAMDGYKFKSSYLLVTYKM